MANYRRFILILLLLLFVPSSVGAKDDLKWLGWSENVFKKAKAEKKYVLLDLEALWCHWCHFMEERTYKHPAVVKYLKEGYITVRADQDAHPDLASRYGDWGWPATVIFDADGNEVAKFRGFIRPSLMVSYLYTILKEPSRVPPVYSAPQIEKPAAVFLNKKQRSKILKLQETTYDVEHGGWGKVLKFLHPDSLDFAMEQVRQGNKIAENRVKASLDAALVLLDKEWGGIYQYSHERDWSAPHYEKIMWFQSQSLRIYSQAFALFGEQKYLNAAQNIYRYMVSHLRSPAGAFYTSQDADVDSEILGKDFYSLSSAKRQELGKFPKIDKNIYARENGWAIQGLTAYYSATGDQESLKQAIQAAEWIIQNRGTWHRRWFQTWREG